VLIAFIDWLFEHRHVQPGTVEGYLAGVKDYFGKAALFQSSALGDRKGYHPLVALAIQSLYHDHTVPALPARQPLTEDMLKRGQQLWSPVIYAVVIIIRGFLLRTGEVLPEGRKFGPHALQWKHIEFWDANQHPLPVDKWTSVEAHYAKICHPSRKWQTRVVREAAIHTRTFFSECSSVLEGLSPKAKGCAVATLQGYYVLTAARCRPPASYLAQQSDGSYLRALTVRLAIRQVAREFNIPDHAICIHSLKHAASSAIADANMTDEEGRMAAGFKDQATLRIYDHPGILLGDRLSHALQLHDDDMA
jgi:hypothetical protein